MSPRFDIRAAGGTDAGRRRKRNEDAMIVAPETGLFSVADGVSSRPQGDVASRLALEWIRSFLSADTTWPLEVDARRDDVRGYFVAAVKHANACIHRDGKAQRGARGMATTFAGLLIDEERACIAHVGDSRVYLFRERSLQALTVDHCIANEFIARGTDPAEARAMEMAGVLSRGLGLNEDVEVTARLELLRGGDVFLVCTDGLHAVVREDDIAAILAELADPNRAVQRLIERANERGGPDNVSAVVVRVAEPSAVRGWG